MCAAVRTASDSSARRSRSRSGTSAPHTHSCTGRTSLAAVARTSAHMGTDLARPSSLARWGCTRAQAMKATTASSVPCSRRAPWPPEAPAHSSWMSWRHRWTWAHTSCKASSRRARSSLQPERRAGVHRDARSAEGSASALARVWERILEKSWTESLRMGLGRGARGRGGARPARNSARGVSKTCTGMVPPASTSCHMCQRHMDTWRRDTPNLSAASCCDAPPPR
mmetsp:Transcript_17102/g.46249  ORF Transcript_17102/g.46249 Transcript_17102/m.46249 type:complete len:225 (+) Transcript_17102:1729-2403(+)